MKQCFEKWRKNLQFLTFERNTLVHSNTGGEFSQIELFWILNHCVWLNCASSIFEEEEKNLSYKRFFPANNYEMICQNNLEKLFILLKTKICLIFIEKIATWFQYFFYMKKHPQKAKTHVNLMNDVPEATLQFLDVFVCVRASGMITFFLDKRCTEFGEV